MYYQPLYPAFTRRKSAVFNALPNVYSCVVLYKYMTISNKRESLILFLGDISVFVVSLWVTLLIRYGKAPSIELFQSHLTPFSIIFALWALVFFIAGLYEKHTTILKSRLPSILFNTQIANSVIAIAFFYFLPYFGINPKTNLFIYLVISFLFILGWRGYASTELGFRKREKAVLIGSGAEMKELKQEVNQNPKYSIYFVSSLNLDDIDAIDFQNEVTKMIYSEDVSSVVIDLKNEKVGPILPRLYSLIFSKVKFIDMYKVYEDIFDRIPLSLLTYNWFLENMSRQTHTGYDFLKRIMDIILTIVSGIPSLIFYPFVYLAIKLDDGGDIFSRQERVGQNNKIISVYKFRTMVLANDNAEWDTTENKVTRIGAFLRKSRIDEFPQLWNVLVGDVSIIGPRPEFSRPVKEYGDKIPYYNIRHIIKPGLSGWAQIHHDRHPHHGVDIEETRNKLSYDLYYIKNRSFVLDLKIALQTLKTLLSRSGV